MEQIDIGVDELVHAARARGVLAFEHADLNRAVILAHALASYRRRIVVAVPTLASACRLYERAGSGPHERRIALIAGKTIRGDPNRAEIVFCTDASWFARRAARGADGLATLLVEYADRPDRRAQVLIASARSSIAAGADLRLGLLGAAFDPDRLSAYFDAATLVRCRMSAPRDGVVPGLPTDDPVAWVQAGYTVLVVAGSGTVVVETARTLRSSLPGQVHQWHARRSLPAQLAALQASGPHVLVVSEPIPGCEPYDLVIDGPRHRPDWERGVSRPRLLVNPTEAEHAEAAALARCAFRPLAGSRRPAREWTTYPVEPLLRMLADDLPPDTPMLLDLRPTERAWALDELKRFGVLSGERGDDRRNAITRCLMRSTARADYARMLFAAAELDVLHDVAVVVALLGRRDLRHGTAWGKHVTAPDDLAQLELYRIAGTLTSVREFSDHGLSRNAYAAVRMRAEALVEEVRARGVPRTPTPLRDERAVRAALLAGWTTVYRRHGRRYAALHAPSRRRWTPAPISLLDGSRPDLIAGEAIRDDDGDQITFGIAVDPELLAAVGRQVPIT